MRKPDPRFAGRTLVLALTLPSAIFVPATSVTAQGAPPTVVSACAGVSLPRSVVTEILEPVAGGIVAPVQGRVNSLLSVVSSLPLVGALAPPLSINVAGLIASAAAGDPITLGVLGSDGTVIGPDDRCDLQSDSVSLADPAGIAIGGNRISGLGAGGAFASAAEIDAIALGNDASTAIGAGGAVAIGSGASVAAANSVAIGAGSAASRGPSLSYSAFALDDPQVSAGEFSVGAAGAERQITNVAAGSAATDAVNVAQLQAVAAEIGAAGGLAVVYDDAARDTITLAGATARGSPISPPAASRRDRPTP